MMKKAAAKESIVNYEAKLQQEEKFRIKEEEKERC